MGQALHAASSPATRITVMHGAFHSAPANGSALPAPSAGSCPSVLRAVRGDGAAQQRTQCHGCQLGVAGERLVLHALARGGAACAASRRAGMRQPVPVSETTKLYRSSGRDGGLNGGPRTLSAALASAPRALGCPCPASGLLRAAGPHHRRGQGPCHRVAHAGAARRSVVGARRARDGSPPLAATA